MDTIVIAGGGLAAQKCAETLRSRGFDGRIRMVCAEPVRPYDRPPLSKEALVGDVDCSLRPQQWYADNDVELLLRTTATGVVGRYLETSAGALRFDRLLIATGAAPRRLPFGSVLRSVADARELRSKLRPGSRLAVVGAGFLGMEVAASARSLGVEVALIDVAPAPLAGLLGPDVSRWLAGLHRDEGVHVVLGEGVAAARRGSLELVGGRRVACDHVVVGIGVVPGASWQTDRPDVFVAGDVTGTQHWDAAVRQARAAARAMLESGLDAAPRQGCGPSPAGHGPKTGADAARVCVTNFWSDQYGLRMQYVGDASAADSVSWDGAPGARDFTAVYSREGRPVAALVVDRPRELPKLRRLITENQEVLT
jgi:NADPH-dependent 2,4-dienoyl-CoA reductase/sulfur reductase-like enzyme